MESQADAARRNPRKSVLRESTFLFKGKTLFVFCTVAGSVSIFASDPLGSPIFIGVVVPIVLMLAYLYFGIKGFVDTIDTETFADSVYYMGFLLTLISLSAALFYLRNENPSLNLLVSKFGLALFTTIVGLAARVTMVNFQIKGSQARHYAEEKLSTSVERFANDLELTCDKMEILLNGVVEKVEMTANSLTAASDQATSSIMESNQANQIQLKEMYDSVGGHWKEAVSNVTKRLEKDLSNSVVVAAGQIAGIGKKVEEEINNFSIDDDVFAKTLETPLGELAHTIRTARILLAKEFGLLHGASKDHNKIQEQFDKLSAALVAGEGTVSALHEYSGKLSAAFATLSSLDTGLEALGSQSESVSRSFKIMSDTVSSSSVSFSEDVETSKESFLKLNQSLNALLHAVMKQSQEMGELVSKISSDADQGRSSLKLVQDNLIESSEIIIKHLR